MVVSNIWVSLAVCWATVFKNVNATPKPLTDGVKSPNQQGEQQSLKAAKGRMVVLTNVG
jgi:hypothetical protein